MKPKYPAIKVRLSGRDGNAFFILGSVGAALRKAKIPQKEIEKFTEQAMLGDYYNLLRVCGEWVKVS